MPVRDQFGHLVYRDGRPVYTPAEQSAMTARMAGYSRAAQALRTALKATEDASATVSANGPDIEIPSIVDQPGGYLIRAGSGLVVRVEVADAPAA